MRFTFFFTRTTYFSLSLIVFIVFPNFRLICSFFVLVTIIIFDLALENGWFEGKILYFNTQIREYHILFTDGTTDYVAAEDFDGIDLILL